MIELVLVHRREEELDFIREHLIELQNNNIDVMFLAEYNINSSKFLERRTANSLMSRHATLKSPLILFKKEGVVVRALYSEEVNDLSEYPDLIIKKYLEALVAVPVIEPEEEIFE
mgnify:CR=1 FL=1